MKKIGMIFTAVIVLTAVLFVVLKNPNKPTGGTESSHVQYIFSDNGRFSVNPGGYGGGYRAEDQPTTFDVITRKDGEVFFERTYTGEDVQTTGNLPEVLVITNDGSEVWGTSFIHGTCPCYLGLWTIDTLDGSITKYPELYDLKIDAWDSDYDINAGISVGVVRSPWPPEDELREELWFFDFDTNETELIFSTDQGRITSIELSGDAKMVSFEVKDVLSDDPDAMSTYRLTIDP